MAAANSCHKVDEIINIEIYQQIEAVADGLCHVYPVNGESSHSRKRCLYCAKPVFFISNLIVIREKKLFEGRGSYGNKRQNVVDMIEQPFSAQLEIS